MQLQVDPQRGVQGNVMVIHLALNGPAPLRERRHRFFQVPFPDQNVDIAAGPHPALRIISPQDSTLQGQKIELSRLQSLAELFVSIFHLGVTVDRPQFCLLHFFQRLTIRHPLPLQPLLKYEFHPKKELYHHVLPILSTVYLFFLQILHDILFLPPNST